MKIFVYGTLRKNDYNHRLLAGATFLGEVTTHPEYTMLHLGGFPGLVSGGETAIKGELYEVDAATLSRLDMLEGHPNFYERVTTDVFDAEGNNIDDVFVYVLPEVYLQRYPESTIPSGDWNDRGNR